MGRKHKESIGRLQQAAHVKPTKHTSAARKHRPNWQTIRMKTLRRKKKTSICKPITKLIMILIKSDTYLPLTNNKRLLTTCLKNQKIQTGNASTNCKTGNSSRSSSRPLKVQSCQRACYWPYFFACCVLFVIAMLFLISIMGLYFSYFCTCYLCVYVLWFHRWIRICFSKVTGVITVGFVGDSELLTKIMV